MTCAQGLLRLLWGGGRSWSATGLRSCHNAVWYGQQSFASRDFYILVFQKLQHAYEISLL